MVEHKDRRDKRAENTSQKHNRKPYVKPQLVEYGHMEKLTQGGTGHGFDAARRRPRRV